MKTDEIFTVLLEKVVMGIMAFGAAIIGFNGYYPLLPAFYGTYCLRGKRNGLVYLGLFSGMFLKMSFQPFMKYVFIIGVINIGIRFYRWANKSCSGWIAGIIAGTVTSVMNCSCSAMVNADSYEITLGLCEGFIVAGATVLLH